MRKIITAATILFLTTLTSVSAFAQAAEKKDEEKPKTTTVDAWREAMPLGTEQTSDTQPVVVVEESKDNVEAEEANAQIEKRVIELEKRLMEALKQRDTVALNHLLADDFTPVGVNITGAQPDKINYIKWATKNLELKSYVLDKTSVRIYPTTAVVTFNYKRQASIAGAPSDGDFTVTDVWIKRGKRWQAVSHHVSQMPKP